MYFDLSKLGPGSHRLRHDCKPGSSSKPLSVTIQDGHAVWHCFRCDETGSSRTNSYRPGDIKQRNVIVKKRSTLSDYGRELWSQCEAITGDVAAYLQARNLVIPPADGDLRSHYNLQHPSGYSGPALVALVTDVVTKEPTSLHRTWVLPDGKKANIQTPRMLLRGHRKAGCVIRLWPDDVVTQGLGIAEGIETGLAAAHGFTPIWVTIDAGNMAACPVLLGIDALTIFADHDVAGLRAALECRRRWSVAAEVTVVTPDEPGADIADVISV